MFSDAGTRADGEPLFKFTHRTFMEYFAAVHLTRTCNSPEELAKQLMPRIAKEEWDVVAQLAIQQADKSWDRGTERAFITMLDDNRRRTSDNRSHILAFIARCCRFAVVPPATTRRIAETVLSYYVANFRRGEFALRPCQELADALPDESSEIAWTAQSDMLNQFIRHGDDTEKTAAVLLALHGVTRKRLALISAYRPERWSEVLNDVAAANHAELGRQAAMHPRLWSLLPFAGAATPHEAVVRMTEAGLSLREIFHEDIRTNDGSVLLVPLLLLTSVDIRWTSLSPETQALIEAYATEYMRLFREGKPLHGDRASLYAHQIYVPSPEPEPIPLAVRDVQAIVTMAVCELLQLRHGQSKKRLVPVFMSNEGPREATAEELTANASEDVVELAAAWFSQSETIFDYSQHSPDSR